MSSYLTIFRQGPSLRNCLLAIAKKTVRVTKTTFLEINVNVEFSKSRSALRTANKTLFNSIVFGLWHKFQRQSLQNQSASFRYQLGAREKMFFW